MSREVKQDFVHLVTFIETYNLKHLVSDSDFLKFISKSHKKYFSYLTFIAELQAYADIPGYTYTLSEKEFNFLKESCSDIGNTLFISLHGSYKGSKLILRSSIETFVKGFYKNFISDIDEETSVFKIFQNVKALPYNNLNPQKQLINIIHGIYKQLCLDVHTASAINMANISALNYFPSFDDDEANSVADLLIKLTSCYLTLLSLKFNEQYHQFHFKNKAIIIDSIPKKYRSNIHNLED